MPVIHKDTNYDVVVKNLRGRQVSCLVPATPPSKNKVNVSSIENKVKKDISESKTLKQAPKPSTECHENTEENNCSHEQASCIVPPKTLLETNIVVPSNENEAKEEISGNETTTQPPQSPIELPKDNQEIRRDHEQTQPYQPLVELPKNNQEIRSNHEKELILAPGKEIRTSTISTERTIHLTPFPIKNKRTYRRRTVNISGIARRVSQSDPDLHDDNTIFTASAHPCNGETPVAPPNTPIVINCDSLNEVNTTPLIKKRGRGRPPGRKSIPPPELTTDEESTCSVLSQDSRASVGNRRSKKYWLQELEEFCEEEEPLSEYEMLRQRNIEENSKMLRQLFMDQGLDFEEKSSSSDTTKAKKSYTRLPLPPPRPKSARLEERQSSEPLDFTKLSQRLSLFN